MYMEMLSKIRPAMVEIFSDHFATIADGIKGFQASNDDFSKRGHSMPWLRSVQ